MRIISFIETAKFKLYLYNDLKTSIPKNTQRNWVFATNSFVRIPFSLQTTGAVNPWYSKLKLFDLIPFIVWNIKSLEHKVIEI